MATNFINNERTINFHDLISASLYEYSDIFCKLNFQYHHSSPMSLKVLCEDGKRFMSLFKDYECGRSSDNYFYFRNTLY